MVIFLLWNGVFEVENKHPWGRGSVNNLRVDKSSDCHLFLKFFVETAMNL